MTCIDCGEPRPGHIRELLIDTSAEMIELGRQHRERLRRLCDLPYRRFLAQRRTREELEAYQRAHGYQDGGVWHTERKMAALQSGSCDTALRCDKCSSRDAKCNKCDTP